MKTAWTLTFRILALLLTGAPILRADALAPEAPPPPFRVVSSLYPLQVALLNIIGQAPGVTLHNLTPPHTGCLHEYQIAPNDLARLAEADLFVINGGGMESFIERTLVQLPTLRILNAGEGLEAPAGSPAAGNSHYWVSPTLHLRQVTRIADGLAQADPARAGLYRRNASNYCARLDAVRHEGRIALAALSRREIITYHDAFAHFAAEFDLHVAAVIAPEHGAQPGARDIARIADLVRARSIPALFTEPQFPALAAQTIARETGIRVFTLDSGATGPLEPDAYINTLRANFKTLCEALRPAAP